MSVLLGLQGGGVALSITQQSQVHSGTNGTVFATATSFTPAANSLMVVAIRSQGASAGSPSSVTGNGITYAVYSGGIFDTGETGVRIEYWVAYAGGSPSAGVTTATWGTTRGAAHVIVHEITGHDASGTADQALAQLVTGSGTGTTGTITYAAAGAADNRPLAMFSHSANELTTPRTNWTELGDGNQNSPAGALETEWRSDTFETTGTATWTTSSAWGGAGVEIKAAATGTTVAVDPGAITLTGQTITTAVATVVSLTPGALTLTGQALATTTTIALTPGALTLAGQTITTSVAVVVPLAPGAVTLVGKTLGTISTVALTPGAITLTGQSITAAVGSVVNVAPGAMTLAGQSLALTTTVAVAPGALTLTGGALGVIRSIPVSPGALTLLGKTLALSTLVAIQPGAITLTGQTLGTTGGGVTPIQMEVGHAEVSRDSSSSGVSASLASSASGGE